MPGRLGHRDAAVLDAHAVGEAAEGLEEVRVGLVAAQPQTRGDVERHLVPAVRDEPARCPAQRPQRLERAEILHEAVLSAQSNCR